MSMKLNMGPLMSPPLPCWGSHFYPVITGYLVYPVTQDSSTRAVTSPYSVALQEPYHALVPCIFLHRLWMVRVELLGNHFTSMHITLCVKYKGGIYLC